MWDSRPMWLSKLSLGASIVFILSCTGLAFALILFIKQQMPGTARGAGPLLKTDSQSTEEAEPDKHYGLLECAEVAEESPHAEDKEENPCVRAEEEKCRDGKRKGPARPASCTPADESSLYHYDYDPEPFIKQIGIFRKMECTVCCLVRQGPDVAEPTMRFCLQYCSDKTIASFFRIVSAKMFRIVRFQMCEEQFPLSGWHDHINFYFFDKRFLEFVLDYSWWEGNGRHRGWFVTGASIARLCDDMDELDTDDVAIPHKLEQEFHDLVFYRNVHYIGSMISRASGRDLGEADGAWFDDLVELFYRLTNNEAELADEDVEAYGELAFLLYPIYVKIAGPSLDGPILFDPAGLNKLDVLMEYPDEILREEYGTTKAEVIRHAIYFSVRKILDRHSAVDMSDKDRCSELLGRFMEGRQPEESKFELLRGRVGMCSNFQCRHVISVMPSELGFMMRTGT